MAQASETVPQWFETLGSKIVHIHFSDTDLENSHVWGKGVFSPSSLLAQIGEYSYNGLLSQYLDNDDYQANPSFVDRENIRVLQEALLRVSQRGRTYN
jgi:protein FrlC